MLNGSYYAVLVAITLFVVESADGKDATVVSMRHSPNVTATKEKYKNYHCLYTPGYRLDNRTKELDCCAYVKKRFYLRWQGGRAYLTTFLDTLKQWQCPELERQCRKRYFDVTPFTNTVYMRACQTQEYRNRCWKTVAKLASVDLKKEYTATAESNISDAEWHGLVHGLNSMGMTYEEIGNPCTQVALYEGGRGGHGRYHESIDTMIPFCGFVWCGYDADTVYGRKISVWTCMPQRCRIGIGIATGIIACLGLATLLGNLTIIAVYWYKRKMNNSQTVYKVTLAIGDTLVGAIVFPTFISTFFILYMTRQTMGNYMKPIRNESLNNIPLQPLRMPSGHISQAFSHSYFNAVGFFTSLSIIISVYTLMLASFDRMAAVCRPMAYNRRMALHSAKYSCAILGFLGLIVATLPIYTRSLRYGLVASILISLSGTAALIFYTIAFAIPLILVWTSTITLLIYSKKHTRVRRRISSVSSGQVSLSERRLARTLGIMVGAFTATILPAAATIISSFFLSDIFYAQPETLNTTSATVYITFEFITIVILTTNSLWNIFVYGSRDKDFGKTAKELFRTSFNKISSSQAWRSIKTVSRRRLTSASISTAVMTLRSKPSDSDLEKQGVKNNISTSTSFEEDNLKSGNNNSTKESKFDPNTDSTWRSFAIDSTAGNLYCSVMENIADGIDEDDRGNGTPSENLKV